MVRRDLVEEFKTYGAKEGLKTIVKVEIHGDSKGKILNFITLNSD